jgi:hypothetical protein
MLEKRYSALTGQLQDVRATIARIKREAERLPELEGKIPALEALIEGAKILLEDVDPTWTPDQSPAIKPWMHHLPVPFGTCGRRGMAVLRDSHRPMTSREAAIEVLRRLNITKPDREVLRRTQGAIEASFRKFRDRTVEASGKYPMQWRTIHQRDHDFDE